ncbi:MAG: spore cortex biosynthesis protein YabQ [Clostridia bacterium]|nr:spore cortex biosynthesis protein YabQ [Clostridia bacterium]
MSDREGLVFANCLLSGVGSGLLFDIFRIIRKSFKKERYITNFCDGLFWTVYTVLFIWWIFDVNDGQLRWYIFAGMIFGGSVYFAIFSRFFVPVGVLLLKVIGKTVKISVLILLFPLKFILKFTGSFFIVVFTPLSKLIKKINMLGRFTARIRKKEQILCKKI